MKRFGFQGFPGGARQRGLSLVELMVAMLLGLLVVMAAVGIFYSSSQVSKATDSLSRLQENARIAFELMARDVREAAGNPCDVGLPVANVLNDANANWWSDWSVPFKGYDDGALPDSSANTDALQLLRAAPGIVAITKHDATGATPAFTLDTAASGLFAEGDILMACDQQQLAIFQAGTIGGSTVNYAQGGIAPGNCSDSLGLLPSVCAANAYAYQANALMARLNAVRWYVKDGSLYQSTLTANGQLTEHEVVGGVKDMQVTYLLKGADQYVDGADVATDALWGEVLAARIVLTLLGEGRTNVDGSVLERKLEHVVSLRNRQT